jgi:hypothetical protein
VLYLAYVGLELAVEDTASFPAWAAELEGPWTEVRLLTDGLLLLDSDHTRSAVYHALKDHLPRGAPLLVAACGEIPKFKGMAPGALAWARARA